MGPPDADARAAGVMPGADPYKELELYLEKVNEEIGEVFEKWDSPITKKSINVVKLKTPPDLIAPQNLVLPNIQGKLPTRKYHSLPRRIKHKNQNFILPPETWLENLLSEFNSIVSDELDEGKVSKGKDTDTSNEDQVDQVAKHSYQNNLPDLISKSCDDLQTGHCQQTQTSPPSSSWRSDSSDCCSVTSLSSIEDGASVLSSAASTPDRLAEYSSSTVNDDFLQNYSNLNLSPDQTQSPFHSSLHSNDFVQSDSSSQVRRDTAESFNQNCNTIPKSPSVRRKDSMRHRTETTSDPNLARPDTLPLRLNSPASLSDTPSSTSLRLENISSELLSNKSSSAPMLKSDGSSQSQRRVLKQPRSQSDRHLTEIEASEACKWLRAAGFPQYAQMFEDHQFPIDIQSVQKDHPFLEPDSLRSLFRRLQCLNKCAKVKMNFPLESINDSDSEPDIAHSNMWTYQKENQRWSRLCNVQPFPVVNDESSTAESPVDNETLSLQSTINQVIDPPCPGENAGKPCDNSPSSQEENSEKKELSFDNNEHLKLVWERKTSTPTSPTSPSNDKQSFNSHKVPGKSSIIRWHSFHNKTLLEESQLKRKSMLNSGQLISLLTVGQLHLLRRLSLLKLTALMDRYCPMSRSSGWTWELPKFMTKKTKFSHFKNSNSVFGVPLLVNIQKTGYALPRFIIRSFEWLINNASDQIGIFRKPGVKTRIQKLREMADEGDFKLDEVDSQQAYDVADLVKQYFRELPEVLLTNKSSETFMSIFQHIPDSFRLEAVSCALVLLPDEHREALYLLLHFLRQIAKHSTENQMTESNLAVCFAPSLFHWNQSASSPYKKNKSGIPDAKELTQNKAAHDCLFYLIAHYDQVFCISKDLLKQCNFSYMDDSIPVTLHELGNDIGCNWRTYLKSCMTAVLKEAKEKSRGWVEFASQHNKVDIFYKKINDEHPLRLWKIVTEVEAPPRQVLKRILWERNAWDPDLAFERSVLKLDTNIDIYNYVDRTLEPLPDRNFCVVRSWITEPARDTCIIVETSVEHADAPISSRAVRGIVLASRYLIEPCGSGRSRILHLSRIDVRGRTCEWYNKAYAFDRAKYVVNIRESFHRAEGMLYDHPNARESKV